MATFALWGSATSLWGRFAILEEEKMWFAIWEAVTAVANALVFLWAGVASINFLIRSVGRGGLGLQESARLGWDAGNPRMPPSAVPLSKQ